MRGKRLPQHSDDCFYPRAGINLLQNDIVYETVGPADFRVEEIKFDKIFAGVRRMTSKLSLEEKMRIQSSWDNLRHTLESLPGKKSNMKRMNLNDLPKKQAESVAEVIDDNSDDDERVMVGNLCPENIEEGNLDEDIEVGMDVCVYTRNKRNRPWVGRVSELLPNKKFVIHWYQRSGRGHTYHAMKNFDGSPFLTEQDLDSIMFWDMSEKRRDDRFDLTSFWLQAMQHEYVKLDSEY